MQEKCKNFLRDQNESREHHERFSDVSYEYINHIYVIYPNVKERTELLCKCLEAISDIISLSWVSEYLRDK